MGKDWTSTTSIWTAAIPSLEELDRVAQKLAYLWRPPAIVLLEGPLGSGKTTLVQLVLFYLGVKNRVKSPSFDFVHQYRVGAWAIYHADLYRLGDDTEMDVLDLPPPGEANVLLMVEWGQRLRQFYPDVFNVSLTIDAAHYRQLQVAAEGDATANRMADWRKAGYADFRA